MKEEFSFEEAAPWLVLFTTLFGGVLRVLLLNSKGMWLDETFSVWIAGHSLPDLLQWAARIDQHPPFYYLLLHVWMTLNSDGPYDVRLLSVVFGAATIPVVYLIGKRLSGPLVGFGAALLLAVSPFNVRFSQETRMYALLTFTAAVAIYALVCLLTDPRAAQPIGRQFRDYVAAWRTGVPVQPSVQKEFTYRIDPRDLPGVRGWIARHSLPPLSCIATDLAWLTFVVFTALTLLTHNTAVFFLLAVNLFMLGLLLYQRGRRPAPAAELTSAGPRPLRAPSLSNWLVAQAGILLLWSPWLPNFIRQSSAVARQFWIPQPTRETVRETLKTLANATTPIPGQGVPSLGNASGLVWALFVAALVLALIYYRRRPSQAALLVTLFAVPLVGELLVSLRRPIFYDRTLIWISIPLFVCLAAGIAQLRFRPLIVLGLLVLASINLFTASDYLRFGVKEDWAEPAGYVANSAQSGDLVVFNSAMTQVAFDYYFREYKAKYSITLDEHGAPDMFERRIPEPIMTAGDAPTLASLLSGRKRAWLIYSHNSYTDPEGLVPQMFARSMNLTRQHSFRWGQVMLYEAP